MYLYIYSLLYVFVTDGMPHIIFCIPVLYYISEDILKPAKGKITMDEGEYGGLAQLNLKLENTES